MLLSKIYSSSLKRPVDILGASVAAVVFAPVMLILSILIRIRLGAPVLFVQQRPGIGGRPFNLLKFRTMSDVTDEIGRLLPDINRLDSFGRAIRASSLDELPELFNVMRGDMSLVGPRPLLMEYLPRYTPQQRRRHEVRPGITGLAQVNGRNALTWERKFELDVSYVDNVSFWLDVKILALTLVRLSRREGINEPGEATVRRFAGYASSEKSSGAH